MGADRYARSLLRHAFSEEADEADVRFLKYRDRGPGFGELCWVVFPRSFTFRLLRRDKG